MFTKEPMATANLEFYIDKIKSQMEEKILRELELELWFKVLWYGSKSGPNGL